jgi:hypothetical protein
MQQKTEGAASDPEHVNTEPCPGEGDDLPTPKRGAFPTPKAIIESAPRYIPEGSEIKSGESVTEPVSSTNAEPILRSDVLSMDDLHAGLRLNGTVRNVVDFGAFIDIGVKQDGLLHRSRLPAGTLLNVGDVVEVEILSIEKDRGRISLGWPGRGDADWATAE